MFNKTIVIGWRETIAFLRGYILRYLPRPVFRTIGRNSRFYGLPNYGSANANITIGDSCMFGLNVFLSASENASITIGNDCSVNSFCHIISSVSIKIGARTRIAEMVSIRDQNHRFDDLETPISEQGFEAEPIVIEEDCWIGRGVFIGAGVTIGRGSIIGANAVVVKDVPAWSVAAGVPARVLRSRMDRTSIIGDFE